MIDSENFSEPTTMSALGAAVVVAFPDVPAVVFELPPDELHAPATMANAKIAAPVARARLNRMGRCPLSQEDPVMRDPQPPPGRRRPHSWPNRALGAAVWVSPGVGDPQAGPR